MKKGIDEVLIHFFKQYKRLHYGRNEVLIHGGDIPQGAYLLVRGQVEQYALSKNGKKHVLRLFSAPSVFPMMWVMGDMTNNYYYEAIEGADVYRAPKEDVYSFLQKHPQVLFQLTKESYRSMKRLLVKMESLMSVSALDRLIAMIYILSDQIGVKVRTNVYELHLTQEKIAEHAGLTRETVSREIQALKKKGIVLKSGNTHLLVRMDLLKSALGNVIEIT